MTPTEYSEELAELLELRGVPVAAVEEIVREVEGHARQSGEDPVSTFGTPAEYADTFAPRSRMRTFWAFVVASALLGFGGGMTLISGVFALYAPESAPLGISAGVLITLGAAGIGAFLALVVVASIRSRRRARDWRI